MPINLAWGIGAAVHFRRTRGTSRPEKVADSPRSKSYASNSLGAMQEGVESERCSQGWLAGSHQASTYAGKYAWSWPRIPAGKSVLGYTLLSACHVLPTWLDCSCVGKWWLRPPTVASMAEATICPWTLLGRRGTTSSMVLSDYFTACSALGFDHNSSQFWVWPCFYWTTIYWRFQLILFY